MPKPPTKRESASRGSKRRAMSAQRPAEAVPGFEGGFVTTPTTTPNTRTARQASSAEALQGRITYTAGPSLTRYSTYPADGISPEIIKAALRNADLGYPRLQAELFEQVSERDAHLRGVAKARIYEVSGKPWRVQPLDETPIAQAVAKFCRAALDEIDGFDSDLDDLLWANGNGYAASEIVWGFRQLRFPLDGGRSASVHALTPSSLDWVHAKHFEFDAITDQPYLWLSGARVPLPANKFVFHVAADTGLIERRGYMRPCTMLHAMKAWAMRDWLLYEALFAIPQVTGSYPADREQYEAQRGVYQQIMRDWGKGVPAFIPDEIKFAITSTQAGGNSSGVHAAICGFVNQEMSKLIQGETLTTEVGSVGAYAATETHADVRFAFIRADARKLEQTLRMDLLRPIVAINAERLAFALGTDPEEIVRAVPRIHWRIDRETSPTQRKDILLSLANAGVPVSLDQVNDEFGVDPPREGARLLKGDPVQVSSGGAVVGSHDAAAGVADDSASGGGASGGGASGINLTATDVASVVTVNEARAAQGLAPWEDERGALTVTEYQAKNAETVATAAAAQSGQAEPDESEDASPFGDDD